MKEVLRGLSSEQVKAKLRRVELKPENSYVTEVAKDLGQTVYGQDEACLSVARAVGRMESGLNDTNRPPGVVFFTGPTGVGKCLHGNTPIYDPVDKTTKTVKERYKTGESFHVYSLNQANNIVITKAQAPQRFTKQKMWKVTFDNGYEISVTDGHRFFSGSGYSELSMIRKKLSLCEPVHLPSISEHALLKSYLNVPSFEKKDANSQVGYHLLSRLYGLLPHRVKDIFRAFSPLVNDVYEPYFGYFGKDGQENKPEYNHHYHTLLRLSMQGLKNLWNNIFLVLRKFLFQVNIFLQFLLYPRLAFQLATSLTPAHKEKERLESSPFSTSCVNLLASLYGITGVGHSQIKSIKYIGKSYYYDFSVPTYENYWACGVFNHNTEMAHALAKHLFNDENSDRLKIIDCSEYKEPHSIQRIIGAPPSYVGYGDKTVIPSEWLHKGRSIIVWDEVEKANPSLHNLLLSVIEDGRLRVNEPSGGSHATPQELDFSHSFQIFTSNAGSREMDEAKKKKDLGFVKQESKECNIKEKAVAALKQQFPPEFIGRIDEVIVFNQLKPEHYEKIYWKFLGEINRDLVRRREGNAPFLTTTREFMSYIMEKSDLTYGARDIRKTINCELLEKVSDLLLNGTVKDRCPVVADYDGEVSFYTDDVEVAPPPVKIPISLPEVKKNGDGGKKDGDNLNPDGLDPYDGCV